MNQYGAGGENPYQSYYVRQAGGGMPYFSGMRTQRGHGWFTRFLSSAVVPAMKTLGQRALVTGANIGTDILEGKDPAESAKGHLASEGRNLANAVISRARKAAQSGSGVSRKRKRHISHPGMKKNKSKKAKVKYPFLT